MAGNKKILLVDDDVDFVEMNKVVLEKQGYQVLCAYDGTEGMTLVKAEKPDLVILDVMMSSTTDGFHVAYDIRKDPQTKDIPILMVTSVNETVPTRFEPDETWLPVDEFIEKPITPKQLIEEVKKRIG